VTYENWQELEGEKDIQDYVNGTMALIKRRREDKEIRDSIQYSGKSASSIVEGYRNEETDKSSREIMEGEKQYNNITPWRKALFDNFDKTVPCYWNSSRETGMIRGFVGLDSDGDVCSFSESVSIHPVPRGFSYTTVSSVAEANKVAGAGTITAHDHNGAVVHDPLTFGKYGETVYYRLDDKTSICVLRTVGLSDDQLVEIHKIFARKVVGDRTQGELDFLKLDDDLDDESKDEHYFDSEDMYKEPYEEEENKEEFAKKTKRVVLN
jgi:hypothetical protein